MDRWDAPQEERYLGLKPAQFNLVFFIIAGAVALGIAVYFGALGAVGDFFGGGSSSSGPAAVEEGTPTSEGGDTNSGQTAEEAARAAVLTLDDMPSGWTKDAPDSEDDDDDFGFSEQCQVLNELDNPPGEIAYAQSNRLDGPEAQSVNSDASVFSNKAAAKKAANTFADAFTRCRDEAEGAFGQALLEEWGLAGYDTSAAVVDFSLKDLKFPKFGDSSTAFRLTGDVAVEDIRIKLTIDFVAIRKGRMVGGFIYTAFADVNSFEEELLAETAAEKLAEANASLAK